MSSTTPTAVATPLVAAQSRTSLWLFGTTLLALLGYYFIGFDQGATSVFGDDAHIHEFIHDARHFMGFPCH